MKQNQFIKTIVVLALPSLLFSQGGNIGNTRVPPAFLGWNGTGPAGSLDIRNDFFNQPIRFFTTASSAERVRIFQTGLSPSAPSVGGMAIHRFPASPVTAPGSLLHIGMDYRSGFFYWAHSSPQRTPSKCPAPLNKFST